MTPSRRAFCSPSSRERMSRHPARAAPPPSLAAAFHRPLPRAFYSRATEWVAQDLIGCTLVHRLRGSLRAARIVETEAYVGQDPANHAFRGPTPRNRSMFLGPGHLYVYRIHQVHCLNATTLPGEAVLLRSAEPLTELPSQPRGPGLLARAFDIGKEQDGIDLVRGEVRILPRRGKVRGIRATPRVGISVATDRQLRYVEVGTPQFSGSGRRRTPRRASGRT
jgi:DNA-3-methyladenine glycosylase